MRNVTITITDSDGNVTFETSTKAMQTERDEDPIFGGEAYTIKPGDLVDAVDAEIRGKFYQAS